jgi:ribosome recycling factor
MTVDQIVKECRERMDKSVAHYERELRGLRTGRATTALIEYVKVNYYGRSTDLRELAAISVPEPTQLLVKPFDPSSRSEIVKAIETADLGLNPQVDGSTIRINVPPPSMERRKQLVNQVRKLAEEARVSIRNERRDANKHVDQLVKDKSAALSEDKGRESKEQIEGMTKKHTARIDEICERKIKEVEEV